MINHKCIKVKLLIIGILLFSNLAFSQAWEANSEWSTYWENKYREDLQSVYQDDFCLKNDIYTYCSATPYQKRAHFAFSNNLPFRIYNPHQDNWITNNSRGPWDNIKNPQERILIFLRFISENLVAGVDHIHKDTYPVKFESLKIGDIFVSYDPYGHVETITKIYKNGLIELSSSTVRPAGQLQQEAKRLYLNSSPTRCLNHDHCGFRRFYPINRSHEPLEKIYRTEYLSLQDRQHWLESNYSDESSFFFSIVASKLSQSKESLSPHAIMHLIFNYMRSYIDSRVFLIEETEKYIENNGYFVEDTDEYNLYSTDNRDRRNLFIPAVSLTAFLKRITNKPINFLDYWLNQEEDITLNYGIKMKFKDFFFFVLIDSLKEDYSIDCEIRKLFSSNPNSPTFLRWPMNNLHLPLNPQNEAFNSCRDAIWEINKSGFSKEEAVILSSVLEFISQNLIDDLTSKVINTVRSDLESLSEQEHFDQKLNSDEIKTSIELLKNKYTQDQITFDEFIENLTDILNKL